MAIETKEQYLERVMDSEKPVCPDCKKEMQLWEVPPITFSDGLGWGTPYMYVCFNDKCPTFTGGWSDLRENYAQTASYRRTCYPFTEQFELMPVFSPMGGQGQIIDEQVVAEQETLKENIKRGFSVLADCYSRKDMIPVLQILTDSTEPARVRIKAAEMIGDFGELEAVEPIRNLKFGNELLQKAAEDAVKKIHERFFTRECPFCAEIIKKRAKICKHCGQDVAGI